MVIIGLFLGWSAYVWAHAKTFGSSPECNAEVKYVYVFLSVRATATWLRMTWVCGLAMTAVSILFGIIPVVMVGARTAGLIEDDIDIEKYSVYISSIISVGLVTYVPLLLLPDGS